jgi:hypothetical protein
MRRITALRTVIGFGILNKSFFDLKSPSLIELYAKNFLFLRNIYFIVEQCRQRIDRRWVAVPWSPQSLTAYRGVTFDICSLARFDLPVDRFGLRDSVPLFLAAGKALNVLPAIIVSQSGAERRTPNSQLRFPRQLFYHGLKHAFSAIMICRPEFLCLFAATHEIKNHPSHIVAQLQRRHIRLRQVDAQDKYLAVRVSSPDQMAL